MIRIFRRQIEKLHEEDGQALVFVALVGLVIFLFLAMTMNVAELVNTKIKNQNVADATALSAAVWQARALNVVSGANRNMLELWAVAIGAGQTCILNGLLCEMAVCGEVWIDPLICLGCLALNFVSCEAALAFFGGAVTTGLFQDMVLDVIDRNIVDPDLPQVVELNYAFKPNTASDNVGHYVYYAPGADLLRSYEIGDAETGDTVLERVGVCPTFVMAARYANYFWHLSDEAFGLPDADWDGILPTIQSWHQPGGVCFQVIGGPELVLPEMRPMFPLALRTRTSTWQPQSVDSLLAITVATYKAQEPPSALGKGFGPADCTSAPNDTRFPCPNNRHYAFASAHAFSDAASEFYNVQMAGLATAHLMPYVSFEMDWEARLFPLEPYPGGAPSPHGGWVAYQDLANQIQNDGFAADYQFLYDNVLMLNGREFFLY